MNYKKVLALFVLGVLMALMLFNSSGIKHIAEPFFKPVEKKDVKAVIREKVPVLMYHSISDVNSELCVSPKDFAAQMKWLKDNKYNTITLQDLFQHWENGMRLPPNPICLTFDDGYQDTYNEAYSLMKEHGFIGVLFIYVNKFQTSNSITKEQLLEIKEYGWEIGNHSYSHVELPRVNDVQLIKETKEAREELSKLIGSDVKSYCYPAGKFNAESINAVRDSSHNIAVTTQYGISNKDQGMLTLFRIRINRSDKINGFIKKLS